ncbi:MAG TPA: DUF2141 domain-containing protein [Azospirillaceae bacterium]|nr:DUF2141 domain-containing protein [Azospirillaceae bacterium]
MRTLPTIALLLALAAPAAAQTAESAANAAVTPAIGAPVSAAVAPPSMPEDACVGDGQVRLRLELGGVRSSKGQLVVTVYPDDEKRFLAKGGKVARVRVLASAPATVACVPVPASGKYAIAVYHDENDNRKFDRTMVGLPAEGYGFSNDAETTLGLPKFEAVLFAADKGENKLSIRMKY